VEELKDWDGQSPPTARTQCGKQVVKLQDAIGKDLPYFGPYAKERKKLALAQNEKKDLLGDNK